MKDGKIRVAVLYGGRSGEHEVSLQSAASVLKYLDRNKFEVVPISIDKQGHWRLGDLTLLENKKSLPVFKDTPEVVLPAGITPGRATQVRAISPANYGQKGEASFDVVFPVMHGTLCEDGAVQGLMELADVAYVGCGILASALGMDKDLAKRVVLAAGLPVAPYLTLKKAVYQKSGLSIAAQIESDLGYPVFVKPANSGSSVGVHKVKERGALSAALEDAFLYDIKVMIEKAITGREIELSVLENMDPAQPPLVSCAGEVIPQHEFYSYEAKYLDENGAGFNIPADLTPAQIQEAQKIASSVFTALECEGLARVDLFLEKDTGRFYFNEINTLPGFTAISMYPKMWEASGLSYSDLLTRLIDLALARHERKSALKRDFSIS